jgi:hypothetical protein
MWLRPYPTRLALRRQLPRQHQALFSLPLKVSTRLGASHPATVPTHLASWQTKCPPHSNRRSFTSSSARPASEEPETQNTSWEDWKNLSQEARTKKVDDWENLSPQAKLKSIEGDRKWGWVIYRCSYAKEWEPTWEKVKRSIIEDLRREIAESDTPSIADTMDFIFIEDPSLEGASTEELQHRFQAWAKAHPDYVYHERSRSRATRFDFFIKADAELMRRGDIGLVQGWPIEPGEEDWIRIDDGDVSTDLYVELDNPEMWYIYYTDPSSNARVY